MPFARNSEPYLAYTCSEKQIHDLFHPKQNSYEAQLTFIIDPAADESIRPGADLVCWSPLPLPVRGGNAGAYSKGDNGYFLIVSGRKENGALVKTVQRYTVNTDTWDTLKPHPQGLLGAGTAILKDTLYLVGGVLNPPGLGQNKVYKLNITDQTWTEAASYPFAIVDAKAVAYKDSLIYAIGGLGGPIPATYACTMRAPIPGAGPVPCL